MSADATSVSAERAFFSDVRLVLAVLNQARYPVLRAAFGVSRDQVNLLTFVLALSAAGATYDAIRRFVRHPWPLDGPDTAIAAAVLREAGFGIAGPRIRSAHVFGALIAVTAMKGLTLPGLRRALHSVRVAEQRVGEQRKRIYGAAVEQLRSERQPTRLGLNEYLRRDLFGGSRGATTNRTEPSDHSGAEMHGLSGIGSSSSSVA